MLIDTKICKG